jgi:hypothetical protein
MRNPEQRAAYLNGTIGDMEKRLWKIIYGSSAGRKLNG